VGPYRALFSTDWNECLAPCGPFDFIAFNYQHMDEALTGIFRQYTGNQISLGQAVGQINTMLPDPITPDQIDAYLDHSFAVYRGVPELIEWCGQNDVLFMINTTGMIGYFQRVFAKGLLPVVPVLSACPLIRFASAKSDPPDIYDLIEIADKGKNSAAVIENTGIAPANIILMGDSGGDGPHFKWGFKQKATLIASMTKPSLGTYCADRQITPDVTFGHVYTKGEPKNFAKEMAFDFLDLVPVIEQVAAR
jgi:hypothetical protein